MEPGSELGTAAVNNAIGPLKIKKGLVSPREGRHQALSTKYHEVGVGVGAEVVTPELAIGSLVLLTCSC